MKSLSNVRLFATPWTVAYKVPPSMEFSRQEYWSRLPFPSPRDLPNPGIELGSPALQADNFTIWAASEAQQHHRGQTHSVLRGSGSPPSHSHPSWSWTSGWDAPRCLGSMAQIKVRTLKAPKFLTLDNNLAACTCCVIGSIHNSQQNRTGTGTRDHTRTHTRTHRHTHTRAHA